MRIAVTLMPSDQYGGTWRAEIAGPDRGSIVVFDCDRAEALACAVRVKRISRWMRGRRNAAA